MKRLIVSLVLLSQVGCAGLTKGWVKAENPPPDPSNKTINTGQTLTYQQKVESWIGHPIDDVVNVAGYPTKTFVAPNGRTVYAWEQSTSGTSPTFQAPDQHYSNPIGPYQSGYTIHGAKFGGDTWVSVCNTYFEVNEAKVIVLGRWNGNGCR